MNLLHCRQNHNLFMKRKWKGNMKNKENAVRLIVHSITRRGEMIRWLFVMVKHRVNNTGWAWNGDETEGWNEAKQNGNAKRFSICTFSIRREVNSWNLHLQKLRGLCKYLANVCNSHSHVYGLHRLLLLTNKAEKSTQWGESSFKRAQRYLNTKYGEVSLQIESTALPPKTTTSLWNENEKMTG